MTRTHWKFCLASGRKYLPLVLRLMMWRWKPVALPPKWKRQSVMTFCQFSMTLSLQEEMKLRNKLLLWRFRHYNKIEYNTIRDIDLGKLEPRMKQTSLPYALMFKDMPEVLERFRVLSTSIRPRLLKPGQKVSKAGSSTLFYAHGGAW